MSFEVAPNLKHPEQILTAWQGLIKRQPHLHGPQAAAALGVPEAALLASRIGSGAVALKPDLPALFASIATWGKVMVVARNRLGAMLNVMSAQVRHDAEGLHLYSTAHAIRLDPDRACSCFLFENKDGHGDSVSINWFDARGDVLGRLLLLSRMERKRVLPVIMRFALDTQSRVFSPPSPAEKISSADVFPSLTPASYPAAEYHGALAVELAVSLLQARVGEKVTTVTMRQPGIEAVFVGRLSRSIPTASSLRIVGPGCKLHLRPDAARTVRFDHQACHIDDAHGGLLTLVPQVTAPERSHWINSLVQGGQP